MRFGKQPFGLRAVGFGLGLLKPSFRSDALTRTREWAGETQVFAEQVEFCYKNKKKQAPYVEGLVLGSRMTGLAPVAVGGDGVSLEEAKDAVDDDSIDDAFKDGSQHGRFSFSFVLCVLNVLNARSITWVGGVVCQ